jgi:DNA-binding PadR family transcriptional regulator
MPKKNISFYALLGILSLGSYSGYDIKKKIEKEVGYFYKVSNGQIYPMLKKMVCDNLASFVIERNEDNINKKIYRIEDKGLSVLKEWLTSPTEMESDNELLLKIYFGSILDVRKNIDLVEKFKDYKKKNIEAYNEIARHFNLSTIKELPDYYSYFTLRFGQIVAQAYVDWSNEIIDILNDIDKRSFQG